MTRTGRSRLGRRDAERLLAGGPARAGERALVEVLSAAAAPPEPAELAGERAAVAAFRRVRDVSGERSGHAPRRTWSRRLVVSVAAGVVALAGGTGLAAATGSLPHAAAPRPRPSVTAPSAVPSSARPERPRPTRTPSPAATGDLCRAWADAGRRTGAMPADLRRALAAAAGGEARVPAYCAPRLAGRPRTRPTTAPPRRRPAPPATVPHGRAERGVPAD